MADQKTIRKHFLVFRNFQQVLDKPQIPQGLIHVSVVKQIAQAAEKLDEVDKAFVPHFDVNEARSSNNDDFYRVPPLQAFVATTIALLEAELDDDESPVIETREFAALKDQKLRAIVERDFKEIQRAFVSQCWKSVIILAGGAIEAVLADLLIANEPRAKAAKSAPKEPDLRKWDLVYLIDVAVELKLVTEGIAKLWHPVREYRNLVHPGKELRLGLTFGKEEARIAVEVLNMLHRDLHP